MHTDLSCACRPAHFDSRFFTGLEGMLGAPLMREGSFRKQLEHEHCTSSDSKEPFKTPQTKGKFIPIPSTQWWYVVDPSQAEDDGTFKLKQHGRNDEPLSYYEAKMGEVNTKLDKGGHARMGADELIDARLYSGPMRARPP